MPQPIKHSAHNDRLRFKPCGTCGVTKPTSLFYWHKVTGPDAHCIECKTRIKRERYAARQAADGRPVKPRRAS